MYEWPTGTFIYDWLTRWEIELSCRNSMFGKGAAWQALINDRLFVSTPHRESSHAMWDRIMFPFWQMGEDFWEKENAIINVTQSSERFQDNNFGFRLITRSSWNQQLEKDHLHQINLTNAPITSNLHQRIRIDWADSHLVHSVPLWSTSSSTGVTQTNIEEVLHQNNSDFGPQCNYFLFVNNPHRNQCSSGSVNSSLRFDVALSLAREVIKVGMWGLQK